MTSSPVHVRRLKPTELNRNTPFEDVPKTICGKHADVRQGLYVFVFANDSDTDVYDNNKKQKIVIHQRGISMKPGKFEDGFATRLHNYNVHLHRTQRGSQPDWVLRECFSDGFLLDLSALTSQVPAPARVFERYWVEAVNLYLAHGKLLADLPIKQKLRAEWRYLAATRWPESSKERLHEYLDGVAQRIFRMAEVGTIVDVSNP